VRRRAAPCDMRERATKLMVAARSQRELAL
jgi:hypothetical protein